MRITKRKQTKSRVEYICPGGYAENNCPGLEEGGNPCVATLEKFRGCGHYSPELEASLERRVYQD